jgi:putative membrane protein
MIREPTSNATVPLDATQLAVERTRLAYERTLMAWVRTSISLIGFGFTIYKFFQYLREQQGEQIARLVGPRTYGMLMIGTGLFTLLLATLQHRRNLKMLPRHGVGASLSLALVLATAVSTLGILALIAAIFRQ